MCENAVVGKIPEDVLRNIKYLWENRYWRSKEERFVIDGNFIPRCDCGRKMVLCDVCKHCAICSECNVVKRVEDLSHDCQSYREFVEDFGGAEPQQPPKKRKTTKTKFKGCFSCPACAKTVCEQCAFTITFKDYEPCEMEELFCVYCGKGCFCPNDECAGLNPACEGCLEQMYSKCADCENEMAWSEFGIDEDPKFRAHEYPCHSCDTSFALCGVCSWNRPETHIVRCGRCKN